MNASIFSVPNGQDVKSGKMAHGPLVSRRDFLLTCSAGAGILLAALATNRAKVEGARGLGATGTPVVARRNGEVSEMIRQCVEALGGIESFVPRGAKVAVKVNGSWNNSQGNTDPEVVRQVVLLVRKAEPSGITVYDHLIQTGGWRAIENAATAAGADAASLGESSSQYISKSVPGVGIKSAKVAKVLADADVLINVPKLKTHSDGQVTIGLKNHLGTFQDRGAIHSGGGYGLHQGIADVNSCETVRAKHRLTICDALRPMVTGGPSSGTHVEYRGILAGVDPVATDYIGTQIIRRYNPSVPKNPEHIRKAAALGLGTDDPSKIVFDERDLSAPMPELGSLPTVAVLAAFAALLIQGRRNSSRSRTA